MAKLGVAMVVLAATLGCSRRAPPPDEPVLAASSDASVLAASSDSTDAAIAPPAWALDGSPDAAVPADSVIVLRLTPCYGISGSCRGYTVVLQASGHVVFDGNSAPGSEVFHAERQIPQEAAEKIFRSLSSVGFWQWKDQYRSPITDHSSIIVAVTSENSSKSVEEYPACSPESGAPPGVCALATAIEDAAGTAEWKASMKAKWNASHPPVPCKESAAQLKKQGGTSCCPPFYKDAAGIRHFKPACG